MRKKIDRINEMEEVKYLRLMSLIPYLVAEDSESKTVEQPTQDDKDINTN